MPAIVVVEAVEVAGVAEAAAGAGEAAAVVAAAQ
jgi:hypothetical protein